MSTLWQLAAPALCQFMVFALVLAAGIALTNRSMW